MIWYWEPSTAIGPRDQPINAVIQLLFKLQYGTPYLGLLLNHVHKHCAFTQCWFDVGPPSTTLSQLQTNAGST